MPQSSLSDLMRIAQENEKRRAEKIRYFFELVNDPDIKPLLEQLFAAHTGDTKTAVHSKSFVAPPGFKNGNGIRDVVRSMKLAHRFTSHDVLKGLEEQNFHFNATDRLGAVRDVLFAMARSNPPEIKRVETGAGGKPNVYERLQGGH